MELKSPWLHQLNRQRPEMIIHQDLSTDVAIIGAGISGVMSAYFLLHKTRRNILLVDAGRVAHGATGHNAGQLVSYFERPFFEIVEEYGLDMAAQGQKDIESAWGILEGIIRKEHIQTPCHMFTGYAGCADLPELMRHLENNRQRHAAGMPREMIYVSRAFHDRQHISPAYRHLYTIVDQKIISQFLETKDPKYIAALSGKKGCLNSAAFCEELVAKLLTQFPRRLTLVEQLPIKTLRLYEDHARLLTSSYRITAKRVVLCTNGFERIKIENVRGSDIDTKFHHLVRGSVGYMAALLETSDRPPTAISYLPSHLKNMTGAYDSDPYYYLTRRPFDRQGKKQVNLICVGGPEYLMDDTNAYHHEHPYPREARAMITRFLRRTYPHLKKKFSYAFFWHGLMGYTPNGLRCIGPEPCNPVLVYNLGCNGVGILPSIFAGSKMPAIIKGEKLPPSIFDPRDQRCVLPQKRNLLDHIRNFFKQLA